jgi:AraC family transcriptional regulator
MLPVQMLRVCRSHAALKGGLEEVDPVRYCRASPARAQDRFLLFWWRWMVPHQDSSKAHLLYAGEKRHRLTLPHLQVTYAWMPPFEGASRTRPNRLEVVFSRHRRVALQQSCKTYDVDVAAGGFYVIGDEPTTLLNVAEHSDTLEMYPDVSMLRSVADDMGGSTVLEPTLGRHGGRQQFDVDGVMLGIAHVLRQVCLGQRSLMPIEAGTLQYLLAGHVLGGGTRSPGQLSPAAIKRVADRIESDLEQPLTLEELAAEAHLSPYHFARSFKRSTGLAPHRYVLARKIEHAKNQLLATKRPFAEIAASVGFENLHHFRRQFGAQFGVLPGSLRDATR